VTQATTMGCGSVSRAPVTRANGRFVSLIAPSRPFVFNEIGRFVPEKNL
jgi:hypothetical protein